LVHRDEGCGGAVEGRSAVGGGAVEARSAAGGGGSGGGGAVTRWCRRVTTASDWDRSVLMDASVEDLHASMLINLLSIYFITSSNPANFFDSSSMEFAICSRSLVALHGGARLSNHAVGKKIGGIEGGWWGIWWLWIPIVIGLLGFENW
jgi:hypothetical protein